MNFPFTIQSSWMIRPVWTEFDVILGKMIQTSPSEGCQFSYPYHKAATVQDGEIKSPAQGMYASIPEVAKLLLHSGDLLVCEGGDIGRSAILESEPLCPTIFQNSIHRVRSKGNYPVEYLKLVLDFYRNSGWIYLFAGKSTISHFTAETFNALKIPFPTPERAKEIVSLAKQLDKETKPLLRQLEKQRELLDEYRQSLITRAVTKGLDPELPMKDPELSFVGTIPNHWRVTTLGKLCFSMRNGYVGPTNNLFKEGGVKYIQSLHIKNGEINFNKKEYYVSKEWGDNHPKIYKDNLLIVQTGDIGQVAVIRENYDKCNCHALIICVLNKDLILPDYLSYYLQSKPGKTLLLQTKTGLGLPHLNTGKVCFTKILVPPLPEQEKICNYCRTELSKIRSIEEKFSAQIARLNEYRTSVISALINEEPR